MDETIVARFAPPGIDAAGESDAIISFG